MAHFSLSSSGVIVGNLEEVPQKESKIIRVFVSSTFTDMSTERNVLMRETFPKVQDYFRKKGYEFQVVDMRWGVREESVLDHMATKLCTEEILNTQKISRGVSFIALLGDKYGSCPLPAAIPTEDFKIFTSKLKVAKISCEVLEEWYKLDENSIPPEYILLPLSDKLPHFNSSDPDQVEKRIKDRNQWKHDQIVIRNLLQRAAVLAFNDGRITEDHKHSYFMAVTEKEISSGILSDPEAKNRTLCFFRQFNHLNSQDQFAARYCDVENGKVDQNSRLLLQQLKNGRIPSKLPPGNIFRYTVDWNSQGVNPVENSNHEVYLEKLSKDVYDSIIKLSEKRILETTSPQLSYEKSWYYDLVHHLEFCNKKVRMYQQRRKLEVHCQRTLRLNKFQIRRQKFLKNRRNKNHETSHEAHSEKQNIFEAANERLEHVTESDLNAKAKKDEEEDSLDKMVTCHKPVVIYGPSGYGKTSLMAKIAKEFCSKQKQSHNFYNDWLWSDKVVKIIRFLGTSPLSCSIRELLISVVKNIWLALNIEPENSAQILTGNFADITEYFHELLWSLESFPGKILLSLDSVDQLSPEDGAYRMHWLPLNFPENVTFFVSMLPDSGDCFANVKRLLQEENCYIEIGPLGLNTAEHILDVYSNLYGRAFTFPQKDTILKAFKKCSQPMFLKLALEIAKEWRSFSDPKTLVVGKSCKELINQLFARLESQHGRSMVWALQYITSSRVGLTDAEIEDLLSLDDHVLQDVYIYHLPPEPAVIRLPPMLWRRIRQQLNEYLVEKEADGTTVVNWYHRQFWEAARIHFSETPKIHHNMAAYFSGIWHGRPKPLTLHKGKKAEYPNAIRNVPPMPNAFGENLANLRKLSELPYHLIKSYNIGAAADILCNFNFLLCKLRYVGLKSLLVDFHIYFNTYAPNREKFADLIFVKMAREAGKSLEELGVGDLTEQTLEVKILYDLLVMSADILNSDWTEFAANIIGRLSPYWKSYRRIERLVNSAKAWIYRSDIPLIVPQYPCFQPPGGLLRTSISHSIHIPGSNKHYFPIFPTFPVK